MSALIIRMSQEKRERLQQVANERKLSVNKLIEEMATVSFLCFDGAAIDFLFAVTSLPSH